MAIRFRCGACRQLMSIATRKAGHEVPCTACGVTLRVPAPAGHQPVESGDESDVDRFADSRGAAGTHRSTDSHGADDSSRAALVESNSGHPADDDVDEPPVKFRRRKHPQEELDMTPMVDVTFLLLIFFMVTATFGRQKVLFFPPPESEKKGVARSVEQVENIAAASIRLNIDARNVVTIDDERAGDLERLPDALRERMRTELKSEVAITADPRALHETVVRVVDACNEAGVQKIRLGGRAASD